MPLLPRRHQRLRSVLDRRMADLTVLLDQVDKPHNLSAILRTCDAVGVLEAHAVCMQGRMPIFNTTSLGSQKWVQLHLQQLKKKLALIGRRLFKIINLPHLLIVSNLSTQV